MLVMDWCEAESGFDTVLQIWLYIAVYVAGLISIVNKLLWLFAIEI